MELAKRIKALEEEIEESRKNNSLFSSPVSYGNNKAKSVYNTSINLISKKEIDENNNTEEENIDTKTMTNINHNNIHTKNAKEEKSPYEMYYDYKEPILRLPSHRILAMNRGEKEGFLKVSIETPDEKILAYFSASSSL